MPFGSGVPGTEIGRQQKGLFSSTAPEPGQETVPARPKPVVRSEATGSLYVGLTPKSKDAPPAPKKAAEKPLLKVNGPGGRTERRRFAMPVTRPI